MRVARWICIVICLVLLASPTFGEIASAEEVSGRGLEKPAAMLVFQDQIFVACQAPGHIVVYDLEWQEIREMLMPEGFVPHEMMLGENCFWILDEDQNMILKIDPDSLEILEEIGGDVPIGLSALFETDGQVLAFNLDGYVYQVEADLELLGWMTGMSRVEAAFYDGFVLYLAGRVDSGYSGVLVKTPEDEPHDSWRLADDPDAPANTSIVERIKLMPTGFFYVVYRDVGIVKYDLEGNIYNRIYQETGGQRVFEDLIYLEETDQYFLSDLEAGIFELKWPEDEIILVEDPVEEMEEEPSDDWWDLDDWNDFDQWLEWVDESLDEEEEDDDSDYEKRLETRTWKGTTTARVGKGRLFGFYHEEDWSIRIRIFNRETEVLKVKVPMADLMKARDAGYTSIQVHLNEEPHVFDLAAWPLAMRNPEIFEDQYLEIRIDSEGWAVDGCYVERVDEITRVVRRDPYE
jgi:hypothetical protein